MSPKFLPFCKRSRLINGEYNDYSFWTDGTKYGKFFWSQLSSASPMEVTRAHSSVRWSLRVWYEMANIKSAANNATFCSSWSLWWTRFRGVQSQVCYCLAPMHMPSDHHINPIVGMQLPACCYQDGWTVPSCCVDGWPGGRGIVKSRSRAQTTK